MANSYGQTNSWTSTAQPGGFWDDAFNWSLGTPSVNHSANLITNAPSKTVVIDECVLQFSPGSTTISNLTLSAPTGSINTLSLTNTPDTGCTGVPQLTVVNDVTIHSGGVLSVDTNATLRVLGVAGGAFNIDGEARLGNAGMIVSTNVTTFVGLTVAGNLTMSGGTGLFLDLAVASNATSLGTLTVGGGTLVASNLSVAGSPDSTGAVWVTGGSLTATNTTTSIGSSGVGQMTVSNGLVAARNLTVGRGAGSHGTLTIAGGSTSISLIMAVASVTNSLGSVVMTGGQLISTNAGVVVGVSGIGEFTMSGGTAIVAGVTLGLSGSARPQGTFTMTGGTFTSTDLLVAGSGDGSTGTVTVAGGQMFVTNAPVFVGGSGIGQMTVSNAPVRGRDLYVAVNARGTLTTGAGSTVTLSSNLLVGISSGSTGTLWAVAGQLIVTNDSLFLGYGGRGLMTVSNATVRARDIRVAGGLFGEVGEAALTLAGGVTAVSSNVTIGDCVTGSTGAVAVSGGQLLVTNNSATATLDLRNGTLNLMGGLLVVDRLVVTTACATVVRAGGTLLVGTLVLDPNLDADGDGLLNGWEQAFGLDPLDTMGANGANGDPDGDGLSNAQEFALGTDPTDSSSPYRITAVAQEGNDIRVTWQTVGGKTNFVQATADLSASFVDITPALAITGAGMTSTNYLDFGAATNFPSSFYRIRLVP
jgi:hypothetical protein